MEALTVDKLRGHLAAVMEALKPLVEALESADDRVMDPTVARKLRCNPVAETGQCLPVSISLDELRTRDVARVLRGVFELTQNVHTGLAGVDQDHSFGGGDPRATE